MKKPLQTSKAAAALGGRAAAAEAVARVLSGRGFAAEHLHKLRARGALAGREAAEATDLALGAVRHSFTLRSVLRSLAAVDERRTPPELRAVLLIGAYELLWRVDVPEYAAVNQAVELAAARCGRRASGMVNAVLRNVARAIQQRRAAWRRGNDCHVRVNQDEACVFERAVLPAQRADGPSVAHLAAATGVPEELFARWVRHYGLAAAESIGWASQCVPAIVIVRNRLRISGRGFASRAQTEFGTAVALAAAGEDRAAANDAGADLAFLSPGNPPGESALLNEGLAYVQDPTAQRAADVAAAEPGMRILDLCAAPGGKTLAMAVRMRDRGELIACDSDPKRVRLIAENVRRLGLTCVQPRHIEADADLPKAWQRGFDLAFVDVPCSNTGVLARRPEARLGFTPRKLASLMRLQGALLERASRAVKPGGTLLYSTCSLEPEENERRVEAFLREHADWSILETCCTLPRGGPNLCDWRDGGFVARLQYGGAAGQTPDSPRQHALTVR